MQYLAKKCAEASEAGSFWKCFEFLNGEKLKVRQLSIFGGFNPRNGRRASLIAMVPRPRPERSTLLRLLVARNVVQPQRSKEARIRHFL